MTRNGPRNDLGPVGLDKLEAALDTYGADRTRWPAPLRHALSGLIASNADARQMLADAEAFDRLLDSAPQYDARRLAKLTDRIVAAAEGQPRLVAARASAVVPPRFQRHHGIAVTALAASLVLGLFAGQTTYLNTTADTLFSGSARTTQQLAQSDDAEILLDEDLL